MLDRTYRCEEVLPLFRNDAIETLKGLQFYLETLEKFIDGQRTQVISRLKPHADRLPSDQQGAFWAWHYPVHWEEIFASQLRSSFVVTLISLAESHVGMVAEQAGEIVGAAPRPHELRGGFFEQHRKYLEKLAGFARPDAKCWDALYEIRDIRNCVVHTNSTIRESRNEDHLLSLIRKLPGLSAPYNVIQLSPEFPKHAFRKIEAFVAALYEEASVLCQRGQH